GDGGGAADRLLRPRRSARLPRGRPHRFRSGAERSRRLRRPLSRAARVAGAAASDRRQESRARRAVLHRPLRAALRGAVRARRPAGRPSGRAGDAARGDGRTVSGAMEISVIVPLYNERANVEPLAEAIVAVLAETGLEHEVLLVDDGSTDGTFEAASSLVPRMPSVRVLRLRRNYGQTPAMAAGIEHARGRILVTMDGDLQNDPRDIPLFLAKLDEGYDMVIGWRHDRKDKLWTRKVPSRIANWLIAKVTGVPVKDNGCSLKAYR